jgi:hypothetical protein
MKPTLLATVLRISADSHIKVSGTGIELSELFVVSSYQAIFVAQETKGNFCKNKSNDKVLVH